MSEKYHSLIVEDVHDTSNYIRQRIEKLCPSLDRPDQAFDLDEAYRLISSKNYNILFLDIQLPKGTGFDLLKRLSAESKVDFEIIFITGESAKEYTLRAIKYSALDFLYKPLDDTELIIAVSKAIEKLQSNCFNRQIKLLLDRVDSSSLYKTNKIALHLYNGMIEFVGINEIKYLMADGVVAYVFLSNGEKLTTTRNLGYYKEMLMIDYQFQPISNSVLINRDFIHRYSHRELLVTLTDGTRLYASKRFGKDFKDSLINTPLTNNGIRGALATLWRKMLS